MAKVKGVRRELGRTEGVLGIEYRKQRVTPVEQHPGVGAAIFPQRRAKVENQPEVLRHNVTNGVTQEKPGSLSCLIVPMESRRILPGRAWE